MSNFVDLITNALLTYGPNRPQAEQELIQRQNSDYKNYLIECVKIIVDQNYSGPQRQAAGTLIKRTASQMDQNGKVNWDKVDLDIQNHAKNALIKTLIDQDQLARNAAANVIATISAIELPRNQWGDIVRSLSDNTNHQDLNIRKTAITTLGYICESLKETQASGQQAFQLQDQVIEHILMGILNGMKIDQQDEGIKSVSLIALRNSIGYLEIYLNKQDVRDFVLKQILDCSTHQNDDIKKEAIMALIEFCKFQYSSLGNYIQNIFNITSNHIQSKNQEISTLAIEIYSSIATEYNDRQDRNAQQKVNQTQEFNQNFLVQIKDQLIQLLLQNFLIESEDDTEPESEIQVSSEQALNAIINSFDDSSALQTFTAFISNTASDSRWIYKQASCLAFGCALEFKDEQQIQQMLFSALSIFINMLKESQQKLVQTAAKFLAKAADLYPNVFLKHPQLQQDLSTIITSLQLSPEISRHVCWVICFLSDALKQNLDSPLNLSITAVIEELLKNALRKDLNNQKDLSLIDCSFMGIMNLIQNSSQQNVSAQYLKHAISHLEQSYNEPQPRKDSLQQGILATIHASILSLCQELGNNQSSDAQQLIETVYKTIMKHFQVIKDVDADGLYVLSALATAIGANFTKYLDEVWPYLQHALGKNIEGGLFKTAIGALADIARACDVGFVKHISVIQTLVNCLKEQKFERQLKLHIYLCIGDIILACKEASAQYLKELLESFMLGFNAVYYLFNTQQASEIEYAEDLQEKIVEAYTCMLHGINNESTNSEVTQSFETLFQFLQFTCDKKLNPTVEYIRSALTLITDIGNFYGSNVSNYVKTQFTQDLISILEKYSDNSENEQIVSYAKNIFQNM